MHGVIRLQCVGTNDVSYADINNIIVEQYVRNIINNSNNNETLNKQTAPAVTNIIITH